MTDVNWTRIPQPIESDRDRRDLCAILVSAGLEVRIVRLRATKSGTPARYIEYRDTGCSKPRSTDASL